MWVAREHPVRHDASITDLDGLSPDQKATLRLLRLQGKGYDDLSELLHMEEDAVRTHAYDALDALAPGTSGLSTERRRQLADWLLGQQSPDEAGATLTFLERSDPGREWASAVADALAPLAGDRLPEIPDARAEPTPASTTVVPGAQTKPRKSSSGKGLFARKMFSAEVVLGDIDPSTVEASVTLDSFGREEDPTDIVAFVPMVVAAVMRACRNAPEVAAPFVGLCSEIAELLLAVGPEECRVLSLRDRLGQIKVSVWVQPDPETMLRAGIPKVTGDPGPRPHRKLRADLKLQKRSGVPFVQIHSANAYIAAMGTAALFEHIAQTQHYRTVTAPIAGSVLRMLELAEELGAVPIPDFDQATLLYLLADRMALDDDPRTFELASLE